MEDRTINQNGQTPIYIEKNSGQIYVGNLYVEEPSVAFVKGSHVLSENDKSDIRLHQTSLIVINSLIIIGK